MSLLSMYLGLSVLLSLPPGKGLLFDETSPISPNLSTILFQIANFLIMAFILTLFFFKPVIKALDERTKKVTSALDEAEKREKEAAAMHAEYEQKVAQAGEMAVTMRQQTQEELGQTRQRLIAEAQLEAEQVRGKAHGEIEETRRLAIYQHRQELGQLVTSLSTRMIQDAGGEAFQKAILEEFIARLEAMPASQYRPEFSHVEDEPVNVHLTSANPVDNDFILRVENQVQRLIDRPAKAQHKITPALIAGATLRFGDVLIDGSLEGQLDSLRTQYIAAESASTVDSTTTVDPTINGSEQTAE